MKPRPQSLVLFLLFCAGLHQVTAQQTAIFTAIQKLTNNETLLQLNASNVVRYRIEAATNVDTWYSLLTLQSTGVNRHADSGAPYLSSRYYRAVEAPTNTLTGDHLDPAYLKLNPNGVVPTLDHDGNIVIDSSVIIEYLDEVAPDRANFTPRDPVKRAAMRSLMRFIDEMPAAFA